MKFDSRPNRLEMFCGTGIGPMVNTESTPLGHREVKRTFMKLKSQVSLLRRYGFMRRRCSERLPCARATPPPFSP